MSNRKISDFPEGRDKVDLPYDFDFLLSRLRGAYSEDKALPLFHGHPNNEMILVMLEKIVEMQKKIDELEKTLYEHGIF